MQASFNLFTKTSYAGSNSQAGKINLRLGQREDSRTAYMETGKARIQAAQLILTHNPKPLSNGDIRRTISIVVPQDALASGAVVEKRRPARVELKVDTPQHATFGDPNGNTALSILVYLLAQMPKLNAATIDQIGADGSTMTVAEQEVLRSFANEVRSVMLGDQSVL